MTDQPCTTGQAPGRYNTRQRQAVLHTLRERRLEQRLSLKGLSERSGIARPIISQIERGRLVATDLEAHLLGDALGLPAGALRIRTVLAYEETAA